MGETKLNKYNTYVELYKLDRKPVNLGSFLIRDEAKKYKEKEEERYKKQVEEYPICEYRMWIDRVEANEGDYVIFKGKTYRISEIEKDRIILESTFDIETVDIDEIKNLNSGSYQHDK